MGKADAQTPAVLDGAFHSTEIRNLEVHGPGCIRLWIEQRIYDVRSIGSDFSHGLYVNSLLSHPVGYQREDCTYSIPAPMPVSGQVRQWRVSASREAGARWSVEATPAPAIGGNELGLGIPTEAFRTELDLRSPDVLVDLSPMMGPNGMRFSRKREVPGDLAREVHRLLEKTNSGECEKVMVSTIENPNKDRAGVVREICDVRFRIRQTLGDYQSMNLIEAISLDGYRLPGRTYQVRESYFVTYSAQHAGGGIAPGNMLIERDDGGRLVPLMIW